jgi:hypothetical protein
VINRQANILFIPTSIGGYSAEPQDAPSQFGYYQQLFYASFARRIHTIEGFQVLGEELAVVARQAYLARQIGAVEQACRLMLALPVSRQLENVARYFQALCTWKQGDSGGACQLLELVAEEAAPQYRARALHFVGLTHQERGEVDGALPFYLAAGKTAATCDPLTLAESQQMIAVVRSIHGDHKRALRLLEDLFPLIRSIGKHYPAAYYTFLNHFAVELGEVGRVTEAECALSSALASPFAAAYPEWSETREELEAKRTAATRSIVAIGRAPEAEPSPQIETKRQPEPSRRLGFSWPASNNASFQRSVTPFPAKATSAFKAVSILDRVLDCIGPRAPPRPH